MPPKHPTTTTCGQCAATLHEPDAWTPASTRSATLMWTCRACKHTTLERYERNATTSLFERTFATTLPPDDDDEEDKKTS